MKKHYTLIELMVAIVLAVCAIPVIVLITLGSCFLIKVMWKTLMS